MDTLVHGLQICPGKSSVMIFIKKLKTQHNTFTKTVMQSSAFHLLNPKHLFLHRFMNWWNFNQVEVNSHHKHISNQWAIWKKKHSFYTLALWSGSQCIPALRVFLLLFRWTPGRFYFYDLISFFQIHLTWKDQKVKCRKWDFCTQLYFLRTLAQPSFLNTLNSEIKENS